MKIIAFYLPQFHNIPENDEWWGDGFTEWTNVRSAKPLFKGHKQPKRPLGDNYYDLLDDDIKIWQASIAKKYGIYGFCYYHYWFSGKMLLEKPMEQMLANKSIDIPFCVCWANEPWTKAWVADDKKILIPQKYGGKKEWKEHFDYLLPFFMDERYITENGKPVIIIYRPLVIPSIKEMLEYWDILAKEAGLKGIHSMCALNDMHADDIRFSCFNNLIEWEPHTIRWKNNNPANNNWLLQIIKSYRRKAFNWLERCFGIDFYKYDLIAVNKKKKNNFMSYDEIWNRIINMNPVSDNSLPGAFVRWDNTPRYKEKATVIVGESPEKFKKYLKQQIIHAKEAYHSDKLFMYAWNEWAEGGYLEPDQEYEYDYLNAIREALIETKEFPSDKKEI